MSLAIRGLATALPPHAISQSRAADVARAICCPTGEQGAMIAKLYEHSSIRTRHFVLGDDVMCDILNGTNHSQSPFVPSGDEEDMGPTTAERMHCYVAEAPALALASASKALERSGLRGLDITHLVTVSCTGFMAPGVDVALIRQLGLRPTVQRTHVGFMGCHGAVNGLRVAQAYADSQASARILLCAVELCCLHFHYRWDPKRNVAGALFADGSAAVVGVPATAAQASFWRLTATGSCLFPDSEQAMTWHIGDHGFEMTLSSRVPGLIAAGLRPWLESWLREQGLRIEEVASWAVHPGGPKVLSAVEESLELKQHALKESRQVLAECGNMSSPTILFIIERLRQQNAPRPCVALAFGPGLVAEAALFV